ncbi:hypothetical protein [Streptomyces anulatus]|uniref:hypothetical protein n=1 Tax=Streptomyces anulatus TaxID=1892 RepID=UPI0036291B87
MAQQGALCTGTLRRSFDPDIRSSASARRSVVQHPGGRARVCRDRRIWKKSDQDPADRMPSFPDAQCQYVAEWASTKLRRQLTSDDRELEAPKV